MSGDLEDADEDERASELSTLAAIYPELLIDPSDLFSATIDIPVKPTRPIFVSFPPSSDGEQAGLPTPPNSDDKVCQVFRTDDRDREGCQSEH